MSSQFLKFIFIILVFIQASSCWYLFGSKTETNSPAPVKHTANAMKPLAYVIDVKDGTTKATLNHYYQSSTTETTPIPDEKMPDSSSTSTHEPRDVEKNDNEPRDVEKNYSESQNVENNDNESRNVEKNDNEPRDVEKNDSESQNVENNDNESRNVEKNDTVTTDTVTTDSASSEFATNSTSVTMVNTTNGTSSSTDETTKIPSTLGGINWNSISTHAPRNVDENSTLDASSESPTTSSNNTATELIAPNVTYAPNANKSTSPIEEEEKEDNLTHGPRSIDNNTENWSKSTGLPIVSEATTPLLILLSLYVSNYRQIFS